MSGNGSRILIVLITAFILSMSGMMRVEATEGAEGNAPVRIGMIGSLFRDVPEGTVAAMMTPFSTIMEAQTGVKGTIVPGGTLDQLSQQLAEDKVQIAVFHGIEFAWARQKYPELRPLAIAVNQHRTLLAYLLVKADQSAKDFGDLHDQSLALPLGTKVHSQLFVERRCQACKKEPQQHFSKISTPPNAEEAIDDVVDGVAAATVVDGVTLESYKRRKPGRFSKLKIIQTSEPFPAAAVAYRPGTLSDATLDRFRRGLINANTNILGKQMLTLWKLSGFESVPEDYDQLLANIVKSYPAPTAPGAR